MKKLAHLFLLVLGIALIRTPASFAVMITFDDLPVGNYGSDLTVGNATFQRNVTTAHLEITDATSDGFGKAHSLPHKLSVMGREPLTTEQTSFSVLFAQPIEQLSFWLTGTFHDTTVRAFDSADQLLETFVQTYPQDGPLAPDGRPWDFYYDDQLRFVQLETANISRLHIQPSAHDGFSIDDFGYQVIPEPGSLALVGLGLVGVGLRRRRVRICTR